MFIGTKCAKEFENPNDSFVFYEYAIGHVHGIDYLKVCYASGAHVYYYPFSCVGIKQVITGGVYRAWLAVGPSFRIVQRILLYCQSTLITYMK